MTVRVGVVGLGIGERHLFYLKQMPNVEVVGVCDVFEDRARALATEYQAKPYTSLAAMLDESELDALTICTPPALHADMTELAAQFGVHVLCEKPMAGSVQDCQRMIDVSQEYGIKLMIGLKKRFDPYYEYIRRLFRESDKPPMWATIRYALGRVDKDWFWQEGDGSGPLLENAVHQFDALRSIFGDVHRISAEGGTFFLAERAPVPDVAAVSLRFVSGAVASLGIGYGCEWSMAREEVLYASEQYVIELQGRFDRADQLRYVDRSHPSEVHTVSLTVAEQSGGGFREEFDHFINCIETDMEPRIGGLEGLKAVELCLAVKRAVQSQQMVVLNQG